MLCLRSASDIGMGSHRLGCQRPDLLNLQCGVIVTALYATPTDDGGAMIITDEPHSCGWPERILYLDVEGELVRSGCAGCDQEWVVVS